MSEKLPSDLKYNKDYSWVELEENVAKVGLTKPAAEKVKQFVFIDLPEEGEEIDREEKYVSLEAVKWSGHLSSPVSGKIVEVNQGLFDDPSQINQSPYESWIMKVKLDDKKQLEELMDSKEAEEFYNEEME